MPKVPTGQVRLRTKNRWFRKPLLVIQIQIHETGDYPTNDGNQVTMVDIDRVWWRDATVEDGLIFS